MFILKRIVANLKQQSVEVTDGIWGNFITPNYAEGVALSWVNVTITQEGYNAHDIVPKTFGMYALLSYANKYEKSTKGKGHTVVNFLFNAYEPGNIEGYIIFLTYDLEVETNGERIFIANDSLRKNAINDKIKVTKKGKIKITKIGCFFDVE